jgi:transposase
MRTDAVFCFFDWLPQTAKPRSLCVTGLADQEAAMASGAEQSGLVNSEILAVGIDVAKGRHVAVLRCRDGYKSAPIVITNDRAGFEQLIERAEAAKRDRSCGGVVYALEATGHYGHPLRYFLVERGCAVVGINPAHTKKAKELEDNSPEKSDPKDAAVIADLALQGKGRMITMPAGPFAELRRLGKLRERLVIERTRLTNRHLALVDVLFPELAELVPTAASRSLQRLFSECPTPADIVAMGFDVLQEKLRSWSRGRITADRSARIVQAAKETVGLRDGLNAARLELRLGLEALEQANRRLREVETAQTRVLDEIAYSELLLSIPGIGRATVATVLGETGDLRAFRDADAVIKHSGFNLYAISSGRHQGNAMITKRGRPLLRRQLFLAACRLSRAGAPLGTFHRRVCARRPGPVVVVGGCRKLLRLMVALVRDNQRYEPGRVGVPIQGSAA